MEFREIYRGITVTVRYDPITFTFMGNLSGLGHPVSIQAASYEDLQDTWMKAIDDALLTDNKPIADYAAEMHQSQTKAKDTLGAAVESRVAVRADEPPGSADDDPFSRRRFLR